MLFRDSDVMEALRVLFSEFMHARAFTHGGCYGDQLVVFTGGITQPLSKHFGIGQRGFGFVGGG